MIPENVKVPNIVIPIIYSWITYYIVQAYQGSQIESHIQSGGELFGWGRVIVVGLIGTVVTFAVIFVIVTTFMASYR